MPKYKDMVREGLTEKVEWMREIEVYGEASLRVIWLELASTDVQRPDKEWLEDSK